jgi:hypothetical protein
MTNPKKKKSNFKLVYTFGKIRNVIYQNTEVSSYQRAPTKGETVTLYRLDSNKFKRLSSQKKW